MYVDPRVARGITKFFLSDRPELEPESLEKIIHEVCDTAPPRPKNAGRSELCRHAYEHLLLPLENRGFCCVLDIAPEDPILLCSIVGGNKTIGFRWVSLLHTVVSDNYWIVKQLTVKPHAIWRCMQRVGCSEIAGITEPLSLAFGFATPLMTVFEKEGWKQFAIPVREGLFVGKFDEYGWSLDTYLSRKEHEFGSRWDKFLDLFPDIPQWTQDEVRNLWMTEQLTEIGKTGRIVDRCRWLATPYTPQARSA
ncbi:hypothetical protein [Paraburkholderia silvatlantica]|uniref:hypothetical protein n=1 Tax=Paraburkholderia silvatlantica TaxID=321895 RepID=UPI001060E7EE|nr:hypothetical protein [Paraburkholderia silvatlantica]TDQ93253.1 hypothetical protein C7412_109236 [Paraburkholderia silvatlantica]